jgi:ribosomal protein S17
MIKLYGKVLKIRDGKTVDVEIEQIKIHALYGVKTKKRKKIAAAFPEDIIASLKKGQRVVLKQCRRLSKTKHHIVHELI